MFGRRKAESRHGGQQQAQPVPYYTPPYYEPQGQRVIKHEDAQSEVETPWKQTRQAMRCRQTRYAVISLVVAILSLTFYIVMGRYAVFPIGAGTVVAACIVLYRALNWRGGDTWRLIAPLMGAGLVGVVGVGAYIVYNGVVIPVEAWVLLGGLWLAGYFVYVYFTPLAAAEWRYIAEVYDPNGPTATKMPEARGGVRYPWTDEEGVSSTDIEEIRGLLEQTLRHVKAPPPKEVIRFIRTNSNGRGRDNGGSQPEMPVQRRVALRALTSGRRIPLDAMVTFLRRAGERGTGAREWKAIDGWDEDRWGDVVELWEALGVFERGRPGKSGRFTVAHDDAMYALLNSIETDRPTPQGAVLSGEFTPGGTGQDSGTGEE
jgi:hypothetical protein